MGQVPDWYYDGSQATSLSGALLETCYYKCQGLLRTI